MSPAGELLRLLASLLGAMVVSDLCSSEIARSGPGGGSQPRTRGRGEREGEKGQGISGEGVELLPGAACSEPPARRAGTGTAPPAPESAPV